VRPGQQYAQDWRRWYLPYRLPPAESGGGSGGFLGGDSVPPASQELSPEQQQVAPSSRTLARALEKSGEVRPPNAAAHHIVAASAPDALPARTILQKYGIGLDEAVNGTFLPIDQHVRLHTRSYYAAVNDALSNAKSKEDVVRIIDSIRRRLKAGGFP